MCSKLNTHPIGSAVALSRHGSQLGIQQVPGLVNALGEEQGNSRPELCIWGFTEVICVTSILVMKQNTHHRKAENPLNLDGQRSALTTQGLIKDSEQPMALVSRGSGKAHQLGW